MICRRSQHVSSRISLLLRLELARQPTRLSLFSQARKNSRLFLPDLSEDLLLRGCGKVTFSVLVLDAPVWRPVGIVQQLLIRLSQI